MVQNIYNNNYRNQSSLLPHYLWGHITTYLRTADDKTPYNTVIILISHSEKIYRDLQGRYCPGTNDLCVILLSQFSLLEPRNSNAIAQIRRASKGVSS